MAPLSCKQGVCFTKSQVCCSNSDIGNSQKKTLYNRPFVSEVTSTARAHPDRMSQKNLSRREPPLFTVWSRFERLARLGCHSLCSTNGKQMRGLFQRLKCEWVCFLISMPLVCAGINTNRGFNIVPPYILPNPLLAWILRGPDVPNFS